MSSYIAEHPKLDSITGRLKDRAFAIVAHSGSLYDMKKLLTDSKSDLYSVEDLSNTLQTTKIGHPLSGTYSTLQLSGKDMHNRYTGTFADWSCTDHLSPEATTGADHTRRTPEGDDAWMSRNTLLGCSVFDQ